MNSFTYSYLVDNKAITAAKISDQILCVICDIQLNDVQIHSIHTSQFNDTQIHFAHKSQSNDAQIYSTDTPKYNDVQIHSVYTYIPWIIHAGQERD